MTGQALSQSSRDLVEARKEATRRPENGLASPPDPKSWSDLAPVWKFPSNLECSDEEVLSVFS